MNDVVTTARNAGDFVGFQRGNQIRVGRVDSAFFKRASAGMAVQAFAVVKRLVELARSGPSEKLSTGKPSTNSNSTRQFLAGTAGTPSGADLQRTCTR